MLCKMAAATDFIAYVLPVCKGVVHIKTQLLKSLSDGCVVCDDEGPSRAGF